MRVRSLLKNKKGIDTIIAALLMVVIVVVAAGMVFAYGTSLFGALAVAPKTSTENIRLEYAAFPPATNLATNKTVNMYIRNIGTTPITLTSYYVKDASGDQYAKTSWVGPPMINPGAWANASLPISTLCTGCTTTGTAFTFQSGNAYTVILVTARNNQFSFSVVR